MISAQQIMKDLPAAQRPRPGQGLAIFPGSFNPPSNIHLQIIDQACETAGVDAVWMEMTVHRSKKYYVGRVAEERFQMAQRAVQGKKKVGVTTLQENLGEAGWTSEYFDILRVFVGQEGKLLWIMGSDVLQGMCYYKEKATGLLEAVDHLLVFERQVHSRSEMLALVEEITGWPRQKVESFVIFKPLNPKVEMISSSSIRRYLVTLLEMVPLEILQSVVQDCDLVAFYRSLYAVEDVQKAIVSTRPILEAIKENPPPL